jgi:hypothetical protein
MELVAYTYTAADVVTQIMSNIAMIFDGNAFSVAAKVAALIGIIIAVFSAIFRNGTLTIASFFWPILVAVLMIIPRVDLVIQDRNGGFGKVDDLPIGFAAPISVITTLGAGVSNMFTENLGLDDYQISMDNGHLISLRAPVVYEQVITDPVFQGAASQFSDALSPTKDTTTYVEVCLATREKSGYASASTTDLLSAVRTNDIDDLRVDNVAQTVSGSNGQVYTCEELFDALQAGFQSSDYADKLKTSINTFFGKYQDDTTTGNRYETALGNLVYDQSSFYFAAALNNAMNLAPLSVEKAGGGGQQNAALEDALAQRREKNRGTSAILFETITKTISFIEVWSFSIMPLFLLLMMAGSIGARIGFKYFWMLVWVQLWYPTLLIVMTFLDTNLDALTVSEITDLASYSAFMSEILSLQDVGYLYLSMATAVSMFLVFGTSSALAASMQRDMSGEQHYDPKKVERDTVSNDARYKNAAMGVSNPIYGPGYTSPAAASAGLATFTVDYARQSGTSLSEVQAFAATGMTQVASQAATQASAATTRSNTTQVATSEQLQTSFSKGNNLTFSNVGEHVTDVGQSYTEASTWNLNRTANATIAGNAGTPGNGTLGAKGTVAGTLAYSTGERGGHSNQAGGKTLLNMGTSITDSASVNQNESSSQTDTDVYSKGETITEISSLSDTATESSNTARSETESEAKTASDMFRRTTAKSIRADVAAIRIAGDSQALAETHDMVNLAPEVQTAVNEYLTQNTDTLDTIFPSHDNSSGDAKFAYAALMVTQGEAGNIFAGDPNSEERMAALNTISDEIIATRAMGGTYQPDGTVDTENLSNSSAPNPQDVEGASVALFSEGVLNREVMEGLIEDMPPDLDAEQQYAYFQSKMGTAFNHMNGEQLNGLIGIMRTSIDAARGDIDTNQQSFGEIFAEQGFKAGISNLLNKHTNDKLNLGSDAIEIRMSDLKNTIREEWWNMDVSELDGYPTASEAVDGIFEQRRDALTAAQVTGENDTLADYIALSQIQAGATAANAQSIAEEAGARMAEIEASDPVLQNDMVRGRIQAHAILGTKDEGIAEAYNLSRQEYAVGQLENLLEQKTGREIEASNNFPETSLQPQPMSGNGVEAIRGVINLAESRKDGYDAIVASARSHPGKRPTEMTIGETLHWARTTPGNHAIGLYQFIPDTLERVAEKAGFDHNTVMTPQVQDAMGDVLLEEAGYTAAKNGEIGLHEFMNNMSQIWAGLPNSTGYSSYHGINGNRATITWTQFEQGMQKAFTS